MKDGDGAAGEPQPKGQHWGSTTGTASAWSQSCHRPCLPGMGCCSGSWDTVRDFGEQTGARDLHSPATPGVRAAFTASTFWCGEAVLQSIHRGKGGEGSIVSCIFLSLG